MQRMMLLAKLHRVTVTEAVTLVPGTLAESWPEMVSVITPLEDSVMPDQTPVRGL